MSALTLVDDAEVAEVLLGVDEPPIYREVSWVWQDARGRGYWRVAVGCGRYSAGRVSVYECDGYDSYTSYHDSYSDLGRELRRVAERVTRPELRQLLRTLSAVSELGRERVVPR